MSEEVITNISFDAWVLHIFDRPVIDPAECWNSNIDIPQIVPTILLEYITTLFNNSGELLREFSDAEINQGLWFLIGECTTDLGVFLRDSSISLELRLSCVRSMSQVFEQCLAKRCTSHLSHLDKSDADASEVSLLNSVCYMWWDIFPSWGNSEDPSLRAIDEACIEVMEKTLKLPSTACQESAIHGLHHWKSEYEERCGGLLTEYLNLNPIPELRDYALAARDGLIQ